MDWSLGRWLFILIVAAIIAFVTYFGYVFWRAVHWYDELGPCGIMSGPYEGSPLTLSPDTIPSDYRFPTDGGRIIIAYSNDTNTVLPRRAPLMFMLAENGSVKWAYAFDSVRADIGLTIEGADLNAERRSVHFFNGEFMEPATFHFDDEWNFTYMCQSPM